MSLSDFESRLSAYMSKYSPCNSSITFENFRDLKSFSLFDEIIGSQARKLKEPAKDKFLQETSECLCLVLCKAHGGIPVDSEFAPGVKMPGGSILHHEAWVAKCFSDHIGDSILFKAIVALGPSEHEVNVPALLNEDILRRYCEALGKPECADILFGIIQKSVHLFSDLATERLIPADINQEMTVAGRLLSGKKHFEESMDGLWSLAPCNGTEENILSGFTAVKVNNYAINAKLNPRRHMQNIPEKIIDRFFSFERGWPLSYIKATTVFLQDTRVNPNDDMFKRIWHLWKKAPTSKPLNEVAEILGLLLNLIAKKVYHHNINDFKRILKLVPEGFESIISEFDPKVRQGIFIALQKLFRDYCSVPFALKTNIVELLDSSRGREAQLPWVNKLDTVCSSGGRDIMIDYAAWIFANENLKHPQDTGGWRDDIFGRFFKGAQWILERFENKAARDGIIEQLKRPDIQLWENSAISNNEEKQN